MDITITDPDTYFYPCGSGTSVAVWENYYFVGCPQDSTNGKFSLVFLSVDLLEI